MAWVWLSLMPVLGTPAWAADDFIRVSGQHIRLVTDVAPDEADELIASFDAAVDQWAQLWEVAPDRLTEWTVDAWVMRDVDAFESADQIAADVPDFPYGYAINDRVYVKAQPSRYYTRHLLLHEGTHSLAFKLFQGAGPTWFMEGTAEWLATHRGIGSDIEVAVIPRNSQEVPYWGRFTAIANLRSAGDLPAIQTVMRYQPNLLGDVPTYGCAWAAIQMMRAYPEYRPLILKSAARGQNTPQAFNRWLGQEISPQWPIFAARWRLWTESMDYGWDPSRHQTALSINDPLWDGQRRSVPIVADRGWQSVGVRIPGGRSVRLSAEGTATLADQPKPWVSHPAGVTIRYTRDKPLGQLIAMVLPNVMSDRPTLPTLPRITVGNGATVMIDSPSWLVLKVNDAIGELADNTGGYEVTIESIAK